MGDLEMLACTRRALLSSVAAASLLGFRPACAKTVDLSRVRPGSPEWPSSEDWAQLTRQTGGRVAPVVVPHLDPATARTVLSNPFYLRDQAGLTQSSGWLDAWRSAPSAYVVRAKDSTDVSAAVRFAARHRLRLVVKGGGHSYLGGSNAPDSLLVWTRDMDAIALHDAFVPQGTAAAPVRAVSLGAGCIWLEAYQAVTTQGGRYVQGGGCTTVGVAGLVQGGGFGSFSKGYGLAAASLLEAEIVTADGKLRVVNAARDADLFWALKGGGGGTFGVVTSLTLQTHDLPDSFGLVHWSLTATSDEAFRALLERFVAVYAERLFNPHWGEQATAGHGNVFQVTMLFQGLDEAKARDAWQPMADFVAAHPRDYRVDAPLLVAAFPARNFWDEAFLRQHMPQVLHVDDRAGARPWDWWWAGNTNEAGAFWHGYHSLWMPASLLAPDDRESLARAWFQASRHWSVTFHFNKGLAGAAPDAAEASRQTAMNPQVLDAFALAIIADDGPSAFAPFPQPDLPGARDDAARMARSVAALRQAAPQSGSYLSESDYGLADWKTACWGDHALRLDTIKRRYDPGDLFIVHHGIGSDRWSVDGFDAM